MKRLLLIIPLVVLLFARCDDDSIASDYLEGSWVQVANAKGSAIILEFDDDGMLEVRNGTSKDLPFGLIEEWDYRLTIDSMLVISYDTYDDDNSYSYSYDLQLSTDDNLNTLYLTYCHNQNNTYHYTFFRR